MSSSSVGCSRSGSACCLDLLCCSLFSWAWAACCLSSSAFLFCFLCLFLNFFSSDGAKFSANKRDGKVRGWANFCSFSVQAHLLFWFADFFFPFLFEVLETTKKYALKLNWIFYIDCKFAVLVLPNKILFFFIFVKMFHSSYLYRCGKMS